MRTNVCLVPTRRSTRRLKNRTTKAIQADRQVPKATLAELCKNELPRAAAFEGLCMQESTSWLAETLRPTRISCSCIGFKDIRSKLGCQNPLHHPLASKSTIKCNTPTIPKCVECQSPMACNRRRRAIIIMSSCGLRLSSLPPHTAQ